MQLYIKGVSPLILVYATLFSINTLALTPTNTTVEANWRSTLQQTVSQHPDVLAAKKSIDSEAAYVHSQSKPLYNPELSADMSRKGDDTNVQIGVEQTLDWWGKSELHYKKAQTQEKIKRYQAQQIEQQIIFKLLSALLEWKNTHALFNISQQRAKQLEQLRFTLNQQYQAGDISYLDNQLAQLAQTQLQQETQAIESQYKQALAEVSLWIPKFDPLLFSAIPNTFWKNIQSPSDIKTDELLNLRIQQLVIEEQRIDEKIVNAQSKPEPTVGIYTGREENENVIGLSVSVPLNLRNNYQSTIEASKTKTQALLAKYEAKIHQKTQQLKTQWVLLKNHERQYQSLEQSRSLNNSNYLQKLLNKQLALNDISVSEYLRSSQLFLDVKTARIYAKQQWLKTQLEYLLLSDQLLPAFTAFVEESIGVTYE